MKIAAVTLLLALISMAAITPGSAQTGQEAVDAFPTARCALLCRFLRVARPTLWPVFWARS